MQEFPERMKERQIVVRPQSGSLEEAQVYCPGWVELMGAGWSSSNRACKGSAVAVTFRMLLGSTVARRQRRFECGWALLSPPAGASASCCLWQDQAVLEDIRALAPSQTCLSQSRTPVCRRKLKLMSG